MPVAKTDFQTAAVLETAGLGTKHLGLTEFDVFD